MILREERIGGQRLILGDCLERMAELPDNSVDSVVTDPPYGLSFMGKRWDYDVPSVEIWAECLRVLKPGGHLLAFAGTRTQHRMAVRIEDAGFEIRDMIAWVYSTGFPKSHNLDRLRGSAICGCDAATEEIPGKSSPERALHSLRDADVSPSVDTCEGRREVLQPRVSEQGAPATGWAELSGSEVRFGEPGVEGRRDIPQATRELRLGEVCPLSAGVHFNGSQGRLCDGASSSDGADGAASVASDGMRASYRPRPTEQLSGKSGTVAVQSKSQDGRVWPLCGRCGKQRIPSGLGTSLKPSLEPVTVARKPLIGTVADNVLTHGTGGLNIDGCRVGTDDVLSFGSRQIGDGRKYNPISPERMTLGKQNDLGRWPANLIHDGSDEVMSGFPQAGGGFGVRGAGPTDGRTSYAMAGQGQIVGYGDTGSAARFFYCAKASKRDRDEGNIHPTVKPTDLMRYLCRLVTPPGGVILDPFMGSGSTGKAAEHEGFRFIGIERDPEYFNISRHRIAAAWAASLQKGFDL